MKNMSELEMQIQVSASAYLLKRENRFLLSPEGYYPETRTKAIELKEFILEAVDRIFDAKNGNLRVLGNQHRDLNNKYSVDIYKGLTRTVKHQVINNMITTGLKHFENQDKVYEYFDALRYEYPKLNSFHARVESLNRV